MIVIEREESAVRVAGSSFYSWHKANDPLGTKPALTANAECSLQKGSWRPVFCSCPCTPMDARTSLHMRAQYNKSKKKILLTAGV